MSLLQVAAGARHSLILSTSGAVFAMGDNQCGQLGIIGNTCNGPNRIAGLSGAFVIHIAAGGRHSAAVLDDGTL